MSTTENAYQRAKRFQVTSCAYGFTAKIWLDFVFERATKGALRYREVEGDDGPSVGTLYIRKEALAGVPTPPRLRVLIGAAGEGFEGEDEE